MSDWGNETHGVQESPKPLPQLLQLWATSSSSLAHSLAFTSFLPVIPELGYPIVQLSCVVVMIECFPTGVYFIDGVWTFVSTSFSIIAICNILQRMQIYHTYIGTDSKLMEYNLCFLYIICLWMTFSFFFNQL